MAEVVETNELTAPSQDGWAVDYGIRRDDGEALHAEVRCWDSAHTAAARAANAEGLAAIADRGQAAALEYEAIGVGFALVGVLFARRQGESAGSRRERPPWPPIRQAAAQTLLATRRPSPSTLHAQAG
jgi:hypothetical protein